MQDGKANPDAAIVLTADEVAAPMALPIPKILRQAYELVAGRRDGATNRGELPPQRI